MTSRRGWLPTSDMPRICQPTVRTTTMTMRTTPTVMCSHFGRRAGERTEPGTAIAH